MIGFIIFLLVILLIVVIFIGYKRYKNNNTVLSRTIDSKIDSYHDKKADKELKEMYTTGPLGITQGKIINLSQLLLADTSKEGMVIPELNSSYKVGAIGLVSAMMKNITRVYLGDGDQTFIQFITDSLNNVQEAMIFNKVLSVNPNDEGWEYLLGENDGMMGLYEASIKKNDGSDVVYNRAFDPYDGNNPRIKPVPYVENIVAEDGTHIKAKGEFMLYVRNIDDTQEYCIIQATTVDNESSADVYVGSIIPDETWLSVV